MEDLSALIKARQSTRGLYDTGRAIPKEDLNKILEAGSWAPTAHNMQNFEIVVVDDKQLLEAIGSIRFKISKAAMEENNLYVSFSEEELRKRKTGILNRMTAITEQGKNPEDFLYESIKKAIVSSSALLIVMYDPRKRAPGSEGDFLGKISLGCVMENMWLMAHSLGIALHIVSSVHNDDCEKQIKEILGIPEYFKLAYSCRLGYPASTGGNYLRVRRDVKDFAHFNGFGNK